MTEPYLDHTYHGPAWRFGKGGRLAAKPETISGAFHVVAEGPAGAVLDNGETGEAHGRWSISNRHLDRLEDALDRCPNGFCDDPRGVGSPNVIGDTDGPRVCTNPWHERELRGARR